MIRVEQWADIRRMYVVDGLTVTEIARRTGRDRKTVRKAVHTDSPPRYRRPPRPSKLDPFKGLIHEHLRLDPKIPSQRLREIAQEVDYRGGKTIFDAYVREIRSLYVPKRTYQRTIYKPAELCQFDLWEPKEEIPVGHGQTRRGWVVTCELGWSKVACGALVFSKEAPDILWGMGRCLSCLGGLPKTVVWDREAAIAHEGRPTDAFAAFCGQLALSWRILQAADPESKGLLERTHRFMRTNFEPARTFTGPIHYQAELDGWFERINGRTHSGIRTIPAQRLAEELKQMRPLPCVMPETERRFVIRVPQQPYLCLDTNDYSIDPRFAGRRVEVKATQAEVKAIVLGTGELAARHRRSFAKHLTLTNPVHQQELDKLRGKRPREPEIEIRSLARYDQLIPA